jgi:methanogenic corrinoid protein MtbC1
MRDEEDSFDTCDSWTEARFIRRFAELPQARGVSRAQIRGEFSPSRIFELATHGRVADLQRAIAHSGESGETLTLAMPELFSTIASLEESWKAHQISFGEAIRGLFTIREVIQNIESGRTTDASAMHFLGSGLIGVADGDKHDFGAQIVAEKLYVNGWRTEVSVKGGLQRLIDRARVEHFDFIGISIGYDESLSGLADRIVEIRDASLNRAIYIIVGGAIFAYSKKGFDFLGADHIAGTADDAIDYLNTRLRFTRASRSH